MAGKLSQPGCYCNTGTKSGRSLVKLEVILPEDNRHRQRGDGRFAMRGSVRKGEKKSKTGKKLLGRQSSFLQFTSKPVKCPFQTEREGVQCALQGFKKMVAAMTSSSQSPIQILARFKERYPHLLVNRLHNGEGHVPGVEVGDVFASRAELCLIGLHRRPQAGIDWKDIRSNDGNIVSIALSIVVSGGYEDNLDQGEALIYTGEGGNDLNGSKRQCEDQKLDGGNMALRNSCFLGNPVRVIRGRFDSNKGTRYSHDGLYQVVNWRKEKGISNFQVFKFKLVREAGQKPLRWHFPVCPPRKVLRGFESPENRQHCA